VEGKRFIEHDVIENRAVYIEHTHFYNAHHLVKDLPVDPDTILVWEVQGTPLTPGLYFRPEDFDIYSKRGNGYPLWRNREDEDDIRDKDEQVGETETLAWSVIDLFTQREDLITGNFKVPLYLPPADTNINLEQFH